jgi:hypothetical protein
LEGNSFDPIEILPRNFTGEAEENHKNLSQDSRHFDCGSSQAPPEHRGLPLQQPVGCIRTTKIIRTINVQKRRMNKEE